MLGLFSKKELEDLIRSELESALNFADEYFTEKSNRIVQEITKNVYSLMDERLKELNRDIILLNTTLQTLVATNAEVNTAVNRLNQVQNYQASLESGVGSVLERLPEPPPALTGSR